MVKLSKLSHWGLVSGHLLQNWLSTLDLKFVRILLSWTLTVLSSFACYRHRKLVVDDSNAHTIHAQYTERIVSFTFTSKFLARSEIRFVTSDYVLIFLKDIRTGTSYILHETSLSKVSCQDIHFRKNAHGRSTGKRPSKMQIFMQKITYVHTFFFTLTEVLFDYD